MVLFFHSPHHTFTQGLSLNSPNHSLQRAEAVCGTGSYCHCCHSESLHGVAELGDHPLDVVVGHVFGGADGVGQADGVPRRPRPHPHAPVHPHGDLEPEAVAEGGQEGALGREQLAHEVQRNREHEPAAGELPQAGLGLGEGWDSVLSRLFVYQNVCTT